jgi:hypothetical protein
MRKFAIFLIFLEFLWPHFISRSNLRCPSSVLGGWGTQIIPQILDLAFLQGPPPLKIGVVKFCTLPLVPPSQKTISFAPFGH